MGRLEPDETAPGEIASRLKLRGFSRFRMHGHVYVTRFQSLRQGAARAGVGGPRYDDIHEHRIPGNWEEREWRQPEMS